MTIHTISVCSQHVSTCYNQPCVSDYPRDTSPASCGKSNPSSAAVPPAPKPPRITEDNGHPPALACRMRWLLQPQMEQSLVGENLPEDFPTLYKSLKAAHYTKIQTTRIEQAVCLSELLCDFIQQCPSKALALHQVCWEGEITREPVESSERIITCHQCHQFIDVVIFGGFGCCKQNQRR